MNITAFDLAMRFVGIKEVAGAIKDNPLILAMLKLDNNWPEHDETPWCSAFANFICWMLRVARSKDLSAKSWLGTGRPVTISEVKVGWDVVILERDGGGHVAFYGGFDKYPPETASVVHMLGGNQGDMVSVSPFPIGRIVGLRRLYE